MPNLSSMSTTEAIIYGLVALVMARLFFKLIVFKVFASLFKLALFVAILCLLGYYALPTSVIDKISNLVADAIPQTTSSTAAPAAIAQDLTPEVQNAVNAFNQCRGQASTLPDQYQACRDKVVQLVQQQGGADYAANVSDAVDSLISKLKQGQ